MILNFKRDEVVKLLAHTVASTAWRSLYNQPETEKPGLWLVGDQGVYLMSNGIPALKVSADMEAEAPHYIAYARQCDASAGRATDDWWDNKRASFGGDDGGEFIPAQDLQGWLDTNLDVEWMEMDLTPGTMSLMAKEGSVYPEQPGKVLAYFKKKGHEKEYTRYIATLTKLVVFETPVLTFGRADMAAYIGYLRERNAELQKTVDAQDKLLKAVDPTPKKIIAKKKSAKKRK